MYKLFIMTMTMMIWNCGGTVTTSTAVSVTGVSIDTSGISLEVGSTATVLATVEPANATNKTVAWLTSDAQVATVDSNGVITAEGEGTADITVTTIDGFHTAEVTVTVTAAPIGTVSVSSVSVDNSTISIVDGLTATILATVAPANATDKSVTWSSSSTSVATVDNGVITAAGAGTATITVTTSDGSHTAEVTVTVTAAPIGTVSVSSVSVDNSTISIVDGLTATILATVAPANATDKSVTWSSSSTSVATVDNGVITAAGAGTATITVTTSDGSHTAEVTVTVTAAPIGTVSVSSVSVDNSTISIVDGSTATVTATVLPSNATDNSVTWSSSSTSVATVDNGVITAAGAGTATITVTTTDGLYTATVAVTVTPILVSGVSVDSSEVTLVHGSEATVTATVLPTNATNKTVTWLSSLTSVATVNSNGVITAEGAGTATITVTTEDQEQTATVSVTVIPILVNNVIVSATVGIVNGLTKTVTVTVVPDNAANKGLMWLTSADAIATVDQNGVITALGVGTANITVTTIDGSNITKTIAVTVTASAVSVTGVTVGSATVSIVNGSTATVTAIVSPGEATDNSVTWLSSDDQIATVNPSGVITAVGVGTADITVTTTDGSHTATVSVTVTPILVSSVSVGSATISIVDESTATVTATVLPANAANKVLTWSSSDNQIATVNPSGVITAVGVGTATITVTTTDGSHTATVSVTVTPILVSSVSVGSATISIVDESTATVTATVLPANAANKVLTWSSSDNQIATVNPSGVITAVGVGTATITVTTTDGSHTATVSVTVTPILVSSVSVGSATISIVDESTATVTATVLPANATNKVLTWSSSDDQIATVNPSGVITAVGVGTATITVTTTDGSHTATVTVTVTPILVSSVTVSSATVGIVSGSTATVTATVLPANAANKVLTWSSSDDQIATVNPSGVITAVGVGTATITVTTQDASTITKTIVVTVTASAVSVTGVSVGSAIVNLEVGSRETVVATVVPATATDKTVTWTSSDDQIATVDPSGVITAAGVGTATITVTADGGHTATVDVTVTASAVSVTGVSVGSAIVNLEVGSRETVVATVVPATATDKTVTWTSGDNTIATVDLNGEIIAVGVGRAYITVTSGGQTAQILVIVTAVTPTSVSVDNSISIIVGMSETVMATVLPNNVANKTVTWSSSDEAIATVDSNGVITALKIGTATITVMTEDRCLLLAIGCKATIAVTVTRPVVNVIGVSIVGSSTIALVDGTIVPVVATVLPVDATNPALTWSSSDNAIATVFKGIITGVSVGTATLTVTTADGGQTATVAVIVTATLVNPMSISISDNTLNLAVRETSLVEVIFLPADVTSSRKTLSWSSSDDAIATVDQNGVITAIAVGTANIMVTDGFATATVAVTVIPILVSSVSVGSSTVGIVNGSTATVTATVLPTDAANKGLTWSSSDDQIATVNPSGVITAIAVGTANIIVTTTEGGHTATVAVTITASAVSVSSVSVGSNTVNLAVRETSLVVATVLPIEATNQALIWSSSDNAKATVDVNGVITGVAVGTVTITATTSGGQTATVAVTVIPVRVTSVSVGSTTRNLRKGEVQSGDATVLPSDAANKELIWSSSDNAIATVSLTGLIRGVTAGTATITVRTADQGYTATISVIVTAVSVTGVSVDNSMVSVVVGTTNTVEATVLPSDATNKALTWSSSDNAKATVDANGVITGISAGTANIIVTTVNGKHTATVAVTVTATAVSVSSVNVSTSTVSLSVGETSPPVVVTVLPIEATNKAVTWSSSDNAKATVDANGVITGVAVGMADITVTTVNGRHTAEVAVTVEIAGIVLTTAVIVNINTISLAVGGFSFNAIATVYPVGAADRTVTWSSSDPLVVSVITPTTAAGSGLAIKGLKAGTATITATTSGGQTAEIAVTVQ